MSGAATGGNEGLKSNNSAAPATRIRAVEGKGDQNQRTSWLVSYRRLCVCAREPRRGEGDGGGVKWTELRLEKGCRVACSWRVSIILPNTVRCTCACTTTLQTAFNSVARCLANWLISFSLISLLLSLCWHRHLAQAIMADSHPKPRTSSISQASEGSQTAAE